MITWAERAKAAISQKGQNGTVKTDETAISRLSAVSAVPTVAASAKQERLSTVLAVPSPVKLEKPDLAYTLTEDPDLWCWPYSIAMSGPEIEKFTARLKLFSYFGINGETAEKLADRLVVRDREDDDRSLCLECAHLRLVWSCVNSRNAGISVQYSDSKLPSDFVIQLQRCPCFKPRTG